MEQIKTTDKLNAATELWLGIVNSEGEDPIFLGEWPCANFDALSNRIFSRLEIHSRQKRHQRSRDRTGGGHLLHYAEELGLDMDEFDSEISQRLYFSRVRADLMSHLESGVKWSPTFFIDGIRHFGSNQEITLLAALESHYKFWIKCKYNGSCFNY
jgi:hypothetical protein